MISWMPTVEFDRPPSWSLDASETLESTAKLLTKKKLNSRKGQRKNQKYRSLIASGQEMQRLEETGLRKAHRTVGVN